MAAAYGEYREMFPRKVLKSRYPLADFNFSIQTERVRKCQLHFRLVHADKLPKLDLAQWDISLLFEADAAFNGVRPLHLAAMLGNFVAVQSLVEKGKEVSEVDLLDLPDEFGWTALHFARLTSKKIYNYLLEKGAKQVVNKMGTIPEELDFWIGRKLNQESIQRLFLALPGQPRRCLTELKAEELKKWTGLTLYTDRPFFDYPKWQELWEQKVKFSADMIEMFFEKNRKRTPSLLIDSDQKVRAAHRIPSETLLFVNAGLLRRFFKRLNFTDFFYPPLSENRYALVDVDPSVVGGVSRWITLAGPMRFI